MDLSFSKSSQGLSALREDASLSADRPASSWRGGGRHHHDRGTYTLPDMLPGFLRGLSHRTISSKVGIYIIPILQIRKLRLVGRGGVGRPS